MRSQLGLLLWKCWKTTLRSPGWTIVQCLFTIVLWLIIFWISRTGANKLWSDVSENKDSNQTDIIDPIVKYECNGPCNETDPDIRIAVDKACPENSPICTMIERPPYMKYGDLKLYEFNDSSPVLNVDLITQLSSNPCSGFSASSDQYDHSYQTSSSCKANLYFRPLIAFIAHTPEFKTEWIKKESNDRTSEITKYRFYVFVFFFSIPLILFCSQTTREISEEATSNIKDYLLSMGMARSLYYLHHFIFTYLKAWISIIGCSIIFGFIFGTRMGYTLCLLFSLSLLSWVGMALLVGSIVKKPGTSTFVFFILSVALTFASCAFPVKRTNILLTLLASLTPQFAVQLAFDSFREEDLREIFIAFGDIGNAVQYGFILILIILSAVLYTVLAIFMDSIVATLDNPLTLIRRSKLLNAEREEIITENHEHMDMGESPAVIIDDVHKMYPMGEYAVRGVHLNMYKGQVTALLGHNGAGKSTLFSMISGMTVPSKGSIKIMNSKSVADQQKLIGYCPQYYAIFPKLTVDEHLQFFSSLKGVDDWKGTGQRVLSTLGMADKGEAKANELSGGMKRKLGIAIALAANSPIVLLDEPTAGMDTGARRDFERLLMDWKKDHTILLTTHYTDEAEMLADRIFIMAEGRVFCSGSTQFLRKRFISGCILSFTARENVDVNSAAEDILERITEFVPDAHIDRVRGQQLELRLNSDDKTRHTQMFRMIESESDAIGIQSYSLSLTKLEQVFLKVGEMTGTKNRDEEISTAIHHLIEENEKRSAIPAKIGTQIMYLFLKRLHYDFSHLLSLLMRLAILIVISLVVSDVMIELAHGNTGSSSDLLALPDCYRVGLHSSLHKNINDFEETAKKLGYCITFDSFPSTAVDWFGRTYSMRPPILGALTKQGNDWTIHSYLRNEQLLPALETLAAMSTNPQLKKVKYTLKTPNADKLTKLPEDESKEVIKLCIIGLLIFVTPLMVMRPMAFHIIDHISNYAHQQRLTGIFRATVLLSTFVYDFIIFNVHFLFFIIPLMFFHMDILNTITKEALLIPYVSFIQAELVIIFLYRIFATRAKGESLVTILLTILSVGSIVIVIVSVIPEFNTKLLLLHPTAAVTVALMNETYRSKAILFLFLHLFLLLLPLLFTEFRCFERLRALFAKRKASEESVESGDSNDDGDAILKVRNLHKQYGVFNGVTAVNGISFNVRPHECFGVLGVNGAGKTSVFEMLTCNSSPTMGSATVGGVDCSAPATIGYCPQVDALIDDLSGFNALVVLAALHGYSNPRKVANILIDCVGMQQHANKSSKQYSGGQRRKISVAAALLAQNSLIILDEPTAGIDPVARRDVWNVICALREATNTAVLLTSHSMDEVETLVSTLIIMSRGEIVVMGTPQSVKNQFGAHYEFALTTDEAPNLMEITLQVQEVFPTAELVDSSSTKTIKFRIPRRSDDIFSSFYEKAETLANELHAIDFYFTQATLEDAFIIAANMPIDDRLPISQSDEKNRDEGELSESMSEEESTAF